MSDSLRIVHCLRAPVGGLFRHVRDLVKQQAASGHLVGVVCDSGTGGPDAERALKHLREHCALGIKRVKMSRNPGPGDLAALVQIQQAIARAKIDVLHGHGAKGGAFARLAGSLMKKWRPRLCVFYTPHGGSLHYSPLSPKGRVFLTMERWLSGMTDGLVFESDYSRKVYEARVGTPRCETRVIPNGLDKTDFFDQKLHDMAADFVFVGEMRKLKGVDLILEALAAIAETREVTAVLVGDGPDMAQFQRQAKKLLIDDLVSFAGRHPASQAFARGRCLLVPSRAESFPYIVLEAAAATIPLIATNVGGIPEITHGTDMPLIEPDSASALQQAMQGFLDDPAPYVERAKQLQQRVREQFTIEHMTREITEFYYDKLGIKVQPKPEPQPKATKAQTA